MRAPTIAKMAEDHFKLNYVVSLYPDFPHLITPPDVVIGGNGNLIGIFLPTTVEFRNPNRLLVRLALCRLGLPAHLVCLLIQPESWCASNDLNGQQWNTFFAHFDSVSDAKNTKKMFNKALAVEHSRATEPAFVKIRESCMKRYAALCDFSLSHEDIDAEDGSNENLIDRLIDNFGFCDSHEEACFSELTCNAKPARQKKGTIHAVSKDKKVVAYERFADARKFKNTLREFIDFGVQRDYKMDNGIPYPQQLTAKLLAVATVPRLRQDPKKFLRVAAFGGWAMVKAESSSHANLLIDELYAETIEG